MKWKVGNMTVIADQTAFSDRHSRIAVDEDAGVDECPSANPNSAGLRCLERNWSVHAANLNIVPKLDRAEI
jgi:hypothetical protein